MKTKYGIYTDIKESDYTYTKYKITYYFSSLYYLKVFKKKAEEYALQENMKIEMRYKVPINLVSYFMIAFYKKLEKKGFRIEIEGKEYLSPPFNSEVIK